MAAVLITGDKGYIGTELTWLCPDYESCDLKDGKDYRDLKDQEWDVVFHLAAYVSVSESFSKAADYFENNTHGIRSLITHNKIGKLVFTSTGGAMYGEKMGAKEEDKPNCASPYATSKLWAERQIEFWCAARRTKFAILRLANVYGGDDSIRGEANVHAHFSSDDPIVVYGGDQTRDFVHIKDVVRALFMAGHSDIEGIFNIGSGVETSVIELAREYAASRQVPFMITESRPGEVRRISLDISKAQQACLL